MPNYYVVVKDEDGRRVFMPELDSPFRDKSLADCAALLVATALAGTGNEVEVEPRMRWDEYGPEDGGRGFDLKDWG